MSSAEFRNSVKNAVYAEHGIRLSDDDPVFAVLLANKLILDEAGRSLQQVLKELPHALETSIYKIVAAVEDSEQTVDSLRSEAKGMLMALTKIELENAHVKVKEVINTSYVDALNEASESFQSTLAAADKKIRSMSSSMNATRLTMTNIMLGIALTFTVMFSCIGGYVLYDFAQESKRDALAFYKLSERQQKAIDTLPVPLRKQVTDQVSGK